MVNYTAIEPGSSLGSFAKEPMTLFIIVSLIILIGFIGFIIYSLIGGN